MWLHNSLRGAVGLGLAILVADLLSVQHAFWVALATLSVLRSSALNTGQNIVRAVLGTTVGFIIGGGIVALVGTNTAVLWVLLPFAVLLAGLGTDDGLVRRGPGRLHADPADPLQPPGPRGLADRPGADRGHRAWAGR